MIATLIEHDQPPRAPDSWYLHLYTQILAAIAAGVAVGIFFPAFGSALKPLGEAFVSLIKMVITPVIFLTVVTGIAGISDVAKVGKVFGKAMVYFIAVSTLALVIGLIVGNVVRPGATLQIDPARLDAGKIVQYTDKVADQSVIGFLTHIIPKTPVGALADGDILQVLLIAILFGIAMVMTGPPAAPFRAILESANRVVFKVVTIVMKFAPLGVFGAMAYTIGEFGVQTLVGMLALVATFYLTAFLFVAIVLGTIARLAGFSLWRLVVYLKDELLLILGTSSSESALPAVLDKLERAGCRKDVVGLVIPTGYSFNLDGTNIYMTLAALFIAQATGIELSLGDQILLLSVAMISSKGAAGVTGAGFVTLATTLAIVPSIPVAGMALVLGIDRFMSECRALTNFIGNAVATIVIARWENALDQGQLARALAGELPDPFDTPADPEPMPEAMKA